MIGVVRTFLLAMPEVFTMDAISNAEPGSDPPSERARATPNGTGCGG